VEGILTSVPKLIEGYIRTQWPSENTVMAIFTMNWLVIKAPPTGFFFTSDNPAVLPEVVGIDKFRETGPETSRRAPFAARCVRGIDCRWVLRAALAEPVVSAVEKVGCTI
jgi:hypothetical protein